MHILPAGTLLGDSSNLQAWYLPLKESQSVPAAQSVEVGRHQAYKMEGSCSYQSSCHCSIQRLVGLPEAMTSISERVVNQAIGRNMAEC